MSRLSSIAGRPRIALAGATGRVGAALAAKLLDDPVELVALTRNPHAGRLPPNFALAAVDFDKPATLSEALQGADRLFIAHGTSDRQVANEIALIDAAVAAGVSHIVKLSVMGPATRLHPFDWHMQIEAHLARQDVGYTMLRPSTFIDILARAGAPVADGSWGGTAGDGRVNLIDTRDIAAVARVALLDEGHVHSQRAYHLTGPAAVSMPEIAKTLSQLLDHTVNYQHRTHAEHREVLIASGVSELVADLLLGLDRIFRGSVLAETTSTVKELTGQEPRSTAAWLKDNLTAFRKQPGSKGHDARPVPSVQ
jgi:NAD(P)H dehydrogenase (quinone)